MPYNQEFNCFYFSQYVGKIIVLINCINKPLTVTVLYFKKISMCDYGYNFIEDKFTVLHTLIELKYKKWVLYTNFLGNAEESKFGI